MTGGKKIFGNIISKGAAIRKQSAAVGKEFIVAKIKIFRMKFAQL